VILGRGVICEKSIKLRLPGDSNSSVRACLLEGPVYIIGSCMVLMLLLAEQVILGQKTAGGGRLGVENSSSSSLSLGVVSREKSKVDAPPCNGGRWDAEVRWEEGVAMLFSL
jgi:hypothetical protein